jgi:hypothetical protein
MKKTVTARDLPVPSSYAFDDTPKAFKRMLQRKNGDQEAYKKSKQQQAEVLTTKRSAKDDTIRKSDISNQPTVTPVNKSSTTAYSAATGFKTVRTKRKAHLQARDLKKKLKRFDTTRELPFHPSNTRKDVRDVVQEPPKLKQPKKTFKKVKDDREELKSWSDYEDELEAEELEKKKGERRGNFQKRIKNKNVN